jgi:hypothetical protein
VLGLRFFRELQDLCPEPSSKVHGRAVDGPGPGWASVPGEVSLKMLRHIVFPWFMRPSSVALFICYSLRFILFVVLSF